MPSSKHYQYAVSSHVRGESEFIDDRAMVKGELLVGLVYSPLAHARIKSISTTACHEVEGFKAAFTAEDLVCNRWGTIQADQCYLAKQLVQYAGEVVVVVAADSRAAVREACKKVAIEFEELPAVLSIDQAIAQQSFLWKKRYIQNGNADRALERSRHRLRGVLEMAGQEHFYFESQAAIAYPSAEGELEIYSSTQHPSEVQHSVAQALGLQYSQVVCTVKRVGGGFGGKESQASPFAVYAALVAHKLKVPARLVLSKDDDMIITGKRNPFKNFYEVGFDDDGRITALKARLYSDAGAYTDLSPSIMERALLTFDNAYHIPDISLESQICKTNTPSNTAFRGFGAPKAVATIESILEEVAQYLKKDAYDVRRVNVYQKGKTTPYGQAIPDDTLAYLFDEMKQDTHYTEWRKRVDIHNQDDQQSSYKGLALTAVKFGIGFTTRFLNQGSALVNIHVDGSIQVSTGAVEMGQGVYAKIVRVVSEVFALSPEYINIRPTSTEKNPNTSPTAASTGSDINAQAALSACEVLKETLLKTARAVFERPSEYRGYQIAGEGTAPEIDIEQVGDISHLCFEQGGWVVDKRHPQNRIAFKELVSEAYLNRMPLTAQGFYNRKGLNFNKMNGSGEPFFYYTNGVAASEVSIDKFTAEMKILRSELLIDLGRPINEGIDLGQVQGGFMQGVGWLTTEKLFYREGVLLSHAPSTYKIPTVQDVPRQFNCRLIQRGGNPGNVRSSKAAGEPPLPLAMSVWAAIKNALYYAKQQPVVALPVPATQEAIFGQLHLGEERESD